ncbi:MAG: preprotein translocase subunit SecE [Patescibacteria group bacterium]|nr:preprotein translocase subunit SecE [Patescibacteria group bacterium]
MSKLTQNILVKYLYESKEEMKKVTWPSQKDTIKYSLVVAALSIAAGIYFGFADWLLTLGVEQLINLTK